MFLASFFFWAQQVFGSSRGAFGQRALALEVPC